MLPNPSIVLKKFDGYEALGAAQDLLEARVRRERRRRGNKFIPESLVESRAHDVLESRGVEGIHRCCEFMRQKHLPLALNTCKVGPDNCLDVVGCAPVLQRSGRHPFERTPRVLSVNAVGGDVIETLSSSISRCTNDIKSFRRCTSLGNTRKHHNVHIFIGCYGCELQRPND
jgi:hypothetical protein